MTHDRLAKFVGGGSAPASPLGRVNGTWPLAVLEIKPSGLTLRMRGIARIFGPVERLEATPATLRRAYPVHGLLSSGVGFTDQKGRDFYFFTNRGPRILDLLAQLGYPASREQ